MSWVVRVFAGVTSAVIPIQVAIGRCRSVFEVVVFLLFVSVVKTFLRSLREFRRVRISETLRIGTVVLL